MSRLSLEQILDLPYPSILAYMRTEKWKKIQGYKYDLIVAIILYSKNHLLQNDDQEIVKNPEFIPLSLLPNLKLIEKISEPLSIFSNKAEILRYLLSSDEKSGALMTFGDNLHSQLGIGQRGKWVPTLVQIPNDDAVKMISCGYGHTAIITKYGNLITFGSNNHGQLGISSRQNTSDVPSRVRLRNNIKVKNVSCGRAHTAIVTENGDLMTFGSNLYGELGLNDTRERFTPEKVLVEGKVKTVSCGSDHTAIITETGQLMTFGSNHVEQLGLGVDGLGRTTNELVPTLVNLTEKVKMVSCGGEHTAIITESGKLMTFGYNISGQLGLGDDRARSVPTLVQIPHKEPVKMVSCGENHTAIITKSGRLMTFGQNKYGQLGIGVNIPGSLSLEPTYIELERKKVEKVSCGAGQTAIITEDGQLMTFGSNESGELGLGYTVDLMITRPRLVELLVELDFKALEVSCGYAHTAIIVEDD